MMRCYLSAVMLKNLNSKTIPLFQQYSHRAYHESLVLHVSIHVTIPTLTLVRLLFGSAYIGRVQLYSLSRHRVTSLFSTKYSNILAQALAHRTPHAPVSPLKPASKSPAWTSGA